MVAWYWRLVALGSSIIILGGFLILPVTFDRSEDLRASSTAVGIFAVALLTAGFVLTGLLSFAVRVAIFQVESIFMPSLVACVIGLLTVFYDFLVYKRYHWNTPALLVVIAGAISSFVYGFLVLYTYRKIHLSRSLNNGPVPLDGVRGDSEPNFFQERAFYENYIPNMFPTSARRAPPPDLYDPNAITEEEMQRQQMLMLLLKNEQPPTHGRAPSTFHIEWQGREDDTAATPVNGYYAPVQSPQSSTSYPGPTPGITRQMTRDLPQWDGLWRTPVAAAIQPPGLSRPGIDREGRRREIEMSSRRGN